MAHYLARSALYDMIALGSKDLPWQLKRWLKSFNMWTPNSIADITEDMNILIYSFLSEVWTISLVS